MTLKPRPLLPPRKPRCRRCQPPAQLVSSPAFRCRPQSPMQRLITRRRGGLALAVLALFTALLACAPAALADLGSRERDLEQSIGQDTGQIGAYQRRLRDLRSRLTSIESSLAIQQALLTRSQREL